MGLADCIGKKYKLATSENFDEYMKALGKYTFYEKSIVIVMRKEYNRNITEYSLLLFF